MCQAACQALWLDQGSVERNLPFRLPDQNPDHHCHHHHTLGTIGEFLNGMLYLKPVGIHVTFFFHHIYCNYNCGKYFINWGIITEIIIGTVNVILY